MGVWQKLKERRQRNGTGDEAVRLTALYTDEAPSTSNRDSGDFPGHSAAWRGDHKGLEKWLDETPREHWDSHDSQGLTVAHLCVLRGHVRCLQLLSARGFNLDAESARGWTPMEDAIAKRDRQIAKLLFESQMHDVFSKIESLKPQALDALRAMPDFSLKLDWKFASSVFGFLLRRFAPRDTYSITKRGARFRIDGTLRGIEGMRGILPKWEYGSFTLIIAADESPARVVALDHTRRLALPLAVQASPKELSSDEQVARAMAGGIARMSFKLKDKKFAPVSSWLGKSKEEDINGYRCTVHDLSGVCVTRLVEKTPLGVPVANGPGDMPYEVFLATPLPEDHEEELPLQALFSGIDAKKIREAAAEAAAEEGASAEYDADQVAEELAREESELRSASKRAKPIRARCWLTDGFPLRPQHLRPLLSLLSAANPALGQVSHIVETFGGSRFPIRAQIPLMLSVYLEVAFSDFAFLGGGAGADMGLQGYKELSFDEAKAFLEKERRRKQQRSSRGRRGRGSSDYDTASSGDDN